MQRHCVIRDGHRGILRVYPHIAREDAGVGDEQVGGAVDAKVRIDDSLFGVGVDSVAAVGVRA